MDFVNRDGVRERLPVLLVPTGPAFPGQVNVVLEKGVVLDKPGDIRGKILVPGRADATSGDGPLNVIIPVSPPLKHNGHKHKGRNKGPIASTFNGSGIAGMGGFINGLNGGISGVV
jgi:hypothetical protein